MELEQLVARMNDGMSGGRSFGPAFEQDGTLVIPVAYVLGGGGGGSNERLPGPDGAAGGSAASQGPHAARARPPGKGAGVGFGMVSWPVGAYVVKDGNVRWVPTIDFGQLLIVGSLLLRGVAKRLGRRHR